MLVPRHLVFPVLLVVLGVGQSDIEVHLPELLFDLSASSEFVLFAVQVEHHQEWEQDQEAYLTGVGDEVVTLYPLFSPGVHKGSCHLDSLGKVRDVHRLDGVVPNK